MSANATPIWRVVISHPGLDTDHYMRSPSEPTHAEIEAMYQFKRGNLVTVRPIGWKGPRACAYPGVARVERISIYDKPGMGEG